MYVSLWIIFFSGYVPRSGITGLYGNSGLYGFAFVFLFVVLFWFVCFLGPHPQHMEVLRLGVKSELQVLAYTIATTTWDPNYVCDLHCNARSLTHWVRPGIKPATSWLLVGFVSTVPQWELLFCFLRNRCYIFHRSCTSFHSHHNCRRVPFFLHHFQHL